MTISLERGLRHMAWANQKVFEAVATLPDKALESYIVNPKWTAGEICNHIAGGATWYVFRLEIEDWIDIPAVKTAADVKKVGKILYELDNKLIGVADQEDRELSHTDEQGVTRVRWASTILTQAIHHATEHRTQLVDALESKGYAPISLDDIDLWSFEGVERKE